MSWEELFSPVVLENAYDRTKTYLRGEGWKDPVEEMAFRAAAPENLHRLHHQLTTKDLKLQDFRMIPWPKGSDRTRRYVHSALRDQVALTSLASLVAPFLEARMLNVSFGNRFYRDRTLERSDPDGEEGLTWKRQPFSYADPSFYEPYSRGYGLYRRATQWVVDAALGPAEEPSFDQLPRFDVHYIPYGRSFANFREQWEQTDQVYWAELDLAAAFPSIDLEALKRDGRRLLNGEIDSTFNDGREWGVETIQEGEPFIEPDSPFLDDHPWRRMVGSTGLQVDVFEYLIDLIDETSCEYWENPLPNHHDLRKDIQHPAIGKDIVPEENESFYDTHGLWRPEQAEGLHEGGLPTGLVVSGMLQNIVLTPVDYKMASWIDDRISAQESPVAYFRFSDDLRILAPNPGTLAEALEELYEYIEGRNEHGHQLLLNETKCKPPFVSKIVKNLQDGEEALAHDGPQPSSKEAITAADKDRFLTRLARDISQLGDDPADVWFGSQGAERIDDLLKLATAPQDDPAVDEESQVMFALSHLARASWSREEIEEASETFCRGVLRICERALLFHPHRFKVWGHVLPILVRVQAKVQTSDLDLDVLDWASRNLLAKLAWGFHGPLESLNPKDPERLDPLNTWEGDFAPGIDRSLDKLERKLLAPQTDDAEVYRWILDRRREHRRLRASFHRAWFWKSWTHINKTLKRLAIDRRSSSLRTGRWTTFIPDEQIEDLSRWFAQWGRWSQELYPSPENLSEEQETYWDDDGPFLWWWEYSRVLEALASSVPANKTIIQQLGPLTTGAYFETGKEILEYVAEGNDEDLQKQIDPISQDLARAINRGPIGPTPEALENEPELHPSIWLRALSPTDQEDILDILPDKTSGRDLSQLVHEPSYHLWVGEIASFAQSLQQDAFNPPSVEEEIDDSTWMKHRHLRAYSAIRSFMIGHGATPAWTQFAEWFELALPDDREGYRFALDEIMYSFARPSDPDPKLEHRGNLLAKIGIPEIELHPIVATKLSTAIHKFLETDANSVLATPATIGLNKTSALALHRLRKSVCYGNLPGEARDPGELSKTLATNQLTLLNKLSKGPGSDVVGISIAPDRLGAVPAPHPVVLEANLQPAKGNQAALASVFYLWLLTGGEHVLDRIERDLPLLPRRHTVQWITDRWEVSPHTPDSDAIPPWTDELLVRGVEPSWEAKHRLPSRADDERSQTGLGVTEIEFGPLGQEETSPEELREELAVRLVQTNATIEEAAWLESLGPWTKDDGDVEANLDATIQILSETAIRLAEAQPSGQRRLTDRVLGTDWETENDQRRPGPSAGRTPADLVLFPEFYLPSGHVPSIEAYVRKTWVGVLAGQIPYEVRSVCQAFSGPPRRSVRSIVNEAVLILPDSHMASYPGTENHPTVTLRLQKPHPSVYELGLIDFLNQGATTTEWTFVRGQKWKEFGYPGWGRFSVGICSDILDTFVWDHFRGDIQSFFLLAMNPLVELFEDFGRSRGYELFANVAIANQAEYGGTLAWSPYRKDYRREKLRVRGGKEGLAATVRLPIRSLRKHQDSGLSEAIREKAELWEARVYGDKPEDESSEFLPPPTEFDSA